MFNRGKRSRRRRPRPAPLADRLRSAYTHWWLYHTTAFGRALLLGLVLAGSLGGSSIEMPLYRLFFTATAFGLVAWLGGLLYRPRLQVTAQPPQRAVAGQPLRVEVQVKNIGRLPAAQLGAGYFEVSNALRHREEPSLPRLRAGETAKLVAGLDPLRRGLYGSLSLRVFSTFPFHFFRFQRAAPLKHPLLVLPHFHPLATVDLPVSTRYQPGGIALTSNVGESPEYIGNREYRYGDSMRRIDFKAWARLAKPAVREYQEEYYSRIALVLDTHVPRASRQGRLSERGAPSPPGITPPRPSERGAPSPLGTTPTGLSERGAPSPLGHPAFEAAVSLCAAVADVLARGEYILDLFAAGPELYVFRAGRHTAHLENVLEILACVDTSRANPFETLTPAITEELGNIAAVLCIFLDWDESRERLLQEAQDHGCAVKAIVVRDAAPSKAWESSGFDVQCFTPEQIRSGAVESL